MKWTEEEARRFFSLDPHWEGRRSANWEPAQALIAALDEERERTDTYYKALSEIAGIHPGALNAAGRCVEIAVDALVRGATE